MVNRDEKWRQMLRSARIDEFSCRSYRMERPEQRVGGWIRRPEHVVTHAVRGEMSVDFDRGGGRVERVSGPTIYIPAGMLRRGIQIPENGLLVVNYGHFMFHFLQDIDFLGCFDISPSLSPEQTSRFVAIHEAVSEDENKHELSEIMRLGKCACHSMELLTLLLENAELKPKALERLQTLERLADVFIYIADNSGRNFSVSDLAKVACVSQATFYRAFKEATGLPPLHYVRRGRLNLAANMLLANRLSIAEIASKFGYSDAFAFSKSFKKQFGVSPSSFRGNPI